MKKTLTLGTVLLGCCLGAAAQMGSTPNQMPQPSTPPTFPQDQTGQIPSNPTRPADPSAIPPDTTAPGQMTHDHASDPVSQASSSQTSIQGCLSQSSDGSFLLADNSGNSFQLRGETVQLGSYIGKEVKVDGIAVPNSGSTAGAMASPTSSTSLPAASGTTAQFSVSDVHKVAEACTIAPKK
jgi:hypothetical protein